MKIRQKKIAAGGFKFFVRIGKREAGRAYLYLLKNDLHKEPFGFLEDVFVADDFRRQGLGSKLVKAVLAAVRKKGCYKLICTSRFSRPAAHRFYKKFKFKEWGKEFRIDF